MVGDGGCRVQEAVQRGDLAYSRVRSFRAREIDIAARRKRPGRMSPDADAKRRSKRSDRRAGKRALREETEEDEM